MYAQDNILCQFGLINLSSVQQLISQPILIHFWWELYQIAWAFSLSQYVQTAVKNVEAYLKTEDSKHWKMPNKADTPLTTTYRPELDVSRELNVADAAYYQSLIGILRWIVELWRVDVCLEVSMMSSHLALPREGHLEQVLHIFAYLKKYHNTELVYDPSDPVVDENDFERRDWA